MNFLFDTNIFLEILLGQEKKETCKKVLIEFSGSVYISEFSIHSIGIILMKHKKFEVFDAFINDLMRNAGVLTIPLTDYHKISGIAQKYQLDFDDSFQSLIAFKNMLGIITLDSDFKKIEKDIPVKFL